MKPLTGYMINTIQYGTEIRNNEFKPPDGWFKTKIHYKFELTRAALAMSNTPEGGYIFIGIKQRHLGSNLET